MLETEDLTIETTNKPLVHKLNLILNNKDKIAIIGEEGNGKSTLLRTIHNREEVEEYCSVTGEIHKDGLLIGYLEQSLDPAWEDIPASEYFLKDLPSDEVDYDRYTQLNNIFKLFSKLNISRDILDSEQRIGTLSGGERVKMQIAKILVQEPDVLLLDEPTNDLDIETLEWLENFICKEDVPILFVSHDETLLEKTANAILHMEKVKSKNQARNTLKKIDYKTYVEERNRELLKQEQLSKMDNREYRKDKQEISHQKSTVRSAQINIKDSTMRRLLNKKMKNVMVREKKLNDREKVDKPETEEPIYISFSEEVLIPNNRRILELNLEKLSIGEKTLANDIELTILGPQKIGIIGDNGIGKTILLKKMQEVLNLKDNLSVGYMPQKYEEVLKPDSVALDYLLEGLEKKDLDKVATYMGSMRFDWEEMNEQIFNLSDGQKAKLLILKMMLNKNNVLLLDEPTRNLSATSNPIIREILKDFKGTIISISHDRKLLREVCDSVYKLEKTGLKKTDV